jgi:hypothetical protein
MFSIGLRKMKNRLPRRLLAGSRRGDSAFHPRVETLEGRTLPSVSHLSLNLPIVAMIGQTSFSISFTIRIDFTIAGLGSPGPSSAQGSNLRDAGSVSARPANSSQPADVSAPNLLTIDPSAAVPLSRANTVPTGTGTGGELVSLISFTNVSAPSRPVVIKPSLAETPSVFSGGFMGLADQPLLTNTVLPRIVNPSTLDPRTIQPLALPVQAISNRMEFIGGGYTVTDNPVQNDNPGEPAVPLSRPVDPPPPDMEELGPLGGTSGAPLDQAGLTNDAWLPDAMVMGTLAGQDGEGQEVLSPGLAAEAAALAVCLGNFRIGPPEVAAQRGSKRNGETEIRSEKWKRG